MVPGEQERVVVSLEEEKKELDEEEKKELEEEEKKELGEEKNGVEEPAIATVGEKCEVCWRCFCLDGRDTSFNLKSSNYAGGVRRTFRIQSLLMDPIFVYLAAAKIPLTSQNK